MTLQHIFQRRSVLLGNVAMLVTALSSALAYSGVFFPPIESPGPWVASDDGRFLSLYAAGWLLAGIAVAVDMLRARLNWGVTLFTAMSALWTWANIKAWVVVDFHSHDWKTATLYATLTGLSVVLYRANRKIEALESELAERDQLGGAR